MAEIHSKGFAAGNLALRRIAVNSDDNAVFYKKFAIRLDWDITRFWTLPLEDRPCSRTSVSIMGRPDLDIYQLSLVLWRICADCAPLYSRTTYKIACSFTGAGVSCDKPRSDPVIEPPLPIDTPLYLREVIAACRIPKGSERPPAWKLLEMFPTNTDKLGDVREVTSKGTCAQVSGSTIVENIKKSPLSQPGKRPQARH